MHFCYVIVYNQLIISQSKCTNFVFITFLVQFSAACARAAADVVFLVDSSDRVRDSDYKLIKAFLEYVAMTINVDASHVRMGVIQYGRSSDITIDIGR